MCGKSWAPNPDEWENFLDFCIVCCKKMMEEFERQFKKPVRR